MLDKSHIALHPQTQHRAKYGSLALYCPIEGGDYVVDETVKELVRRAG